MAKIDMQLMFQRFDVILVGMLALVPWTTEVVHSFRGKQSNILRK